MFVCSNIYTRKKVRNSPHIFFQKNGLINYMSTQMLRGDLNNYIECTHIVLSTLYVYVI